jgi:hypothetical protein
MRAHPSIHLTCTCACGRGMLGVAAARRRAPRSRPLTMLTPPWWSPRPNSARSRHAPSSALSHARFPSHARLFPLLHAYNSHTHKSLASGSRVRVERMSHVTHESHAVCTVSLPPCLCPAHTHTNSYRRRRLVLESL